MVNALRFLTQKVRLAALLSTLFLVIAGTTGLRAHEVLPSIADLTIGERDLTLVVQMNAEAFIAGIDLDGLEDTDASDLSADYDTLRALAPAELEAAFRMAWPGLQGGFVVSAGGQELTLVLDDIVIPEAGNVDLPRISVLGLSAALPPDAQIVSVGWIKEFGALVLRQMEAGEEAYTGYLAGGEISPPIPRGGGLTVGAWETFKSYVVIGFEHIIPKGLDHILFVLGLFFLALRVRPLVTQITAFTLAHTITLALGILGIVTVPAHIVEPLIALSIVYVAVENILSPQMTKWRPIVVVLFGLLHGLGFASVLGEIGLNPAQFVTSLIAFNIGVEIGQLTVIVIAFVLVGIWFGQKDWYRARIAIPASVVIAAIGAWWSFERVFL